MENLILIVDKEVRTEHMVDRAAQFYLVEKVDSDRYLVEDGKNRLWIEGGLSVEEEYFEEVPPELVDLTSYRTVAINYSGGTEFAKAVAMRLVSEFDCLIDTDHGLIVDGRTFVQLATQHPQWDWRADVDPRPR